ncbi:MAG: DUF5028 domain-containing protein [Lachnospiraceae bacterium]|nr:DUF5028 domain-containing protein [Lachnospiraceae bacterium]
MKYKRIIKTFLLLVLSALMVFLYAKRCIYVNRNIKDAPVKSYDIGEEVDFGKDILMDFTMEGYSVKVNSADIMTYKEFLNKYNGEDIYSYAPGKIYDVSITLKNISADESTGVNIMDFYIQGAAVHAGIDSNLYDLANPKVEGIYAVALRNGTEMEFHLPFGIHKENFNSKTWKNIENFNMNFVATLYPVKKVIEL